MFRLEDYESIKPIIDKLNLKKDSIKTLNIGCGNSEMSEAMFNDGYKKIYNIDIAESIVEVMNKRAVGKTGLKCEYVYKSLDEVMDARDMKYKNNCFDFVVDKSTLDSFLCGEHSFLNTAIYTKEVQRILKVGGVFLIVSYGKPDNRLNHLEREHLSFDIKIYTITKGDDEEEKMHYIYVCTKKSDADQKCASNFEVVYFELEKQNMLEDEEDPDDEAQTDKAENDLK